MVASLAVLVGGVVETDGGGTATGGVVETGGAALFCGTSAFGTSPDWPNTGPSPDVTQKKIKSRLR